MSNDLLDWPVEDFSVRRRDELGQELRAALVRQQGQQRRRRLVAGSAAVTTAACATAAIVLSSAPTASAAWSAVPAPLPIASTDHLLQRCTAGMPTGPARLIGDSALAPVVAERRGSSRAVLLAGEDSQGICIATPSTRTGGRTRAPALQTGQDLSVTGDGGSTDRTGSRYVYGRASRRVASVAVTTSSGLHVTSSVAKGAYVAWWPGGDGPADVVARDAAGRVVASLTPRS